MVQIQVEKLGVYIGHKDSIYALEKGMNDSTFFTASGDGMVVLWDMKIPNEGKLIAKLSNSVYALNYLPETNELIVGQNFEGVHVIDTVTNVEIKSAQITKSAIFNIKNYKNQIFVATGDGYLIVLQKNDLSVITKLKITDYSIRVITVDSSRNHLIVGSSDHLVRIFDLTTLQLIQTLKGHTNSVFAASLSPDSKILITAGRDAKLMIWNMDTYAQLHVIPAHMYAINDISFCASGNYFVTASMDKSIKVWDSKQFKLLKIIDKSRHAGHGTSVNKVLWTEHDHAIISVSDDRTISIWNVDLPHERI
ncbi:WD40 repeat domain-containing protein [uncultured Cytophaga sp.]|uniref:WD40 repeat domain-containing protein n=1 Tax=uncultured Cytophaga sp. TaxID=160238 RepID=UPI00260D2063|nr:WD40 repeat domain-containing protein [uncultured Cytophaga sp.]